MISIGGNTANHVISSDPLYGCFGFGWMEGSIERQICAYLQISWYVMIYEKDLGRLSKNMLSQEWSDKRQHLNSGQSKKLKRDSFPNEKLLYIQY